jgi:ATP-binding cassette subfamily C protein CydC
MVLGLMQLPARRAVLATLAGAGAMGSAVALIGVSAWLIARASQMPPVLDLSLAVVGVRALGIGRGVLRYLERLASHDVALRGLVHLRENLFRQLAGDPRPTAARLRRGDLLARFGADVDEVGEVAVRGLFPFAVSGVVGLAATVAAVLVLPAAGVALGASLLLAGVVSPWLAARAAARAHDAGSQARAAISTTVFTHLDGLDELRVARATGPSRERLDGFEKALEAAEDDAARPAAAAAIVQVAATGIAVVAALLLGAHAVDDGRIADVWLAVLTLLPLAAVEVCAGLAAAAAQIVSGRRAAARLVELLPAPPARPEAAGSAPLGPPGALTGHGLRVGWTTALPVPADVTIPAGTVTALVGPSGSGKTTLAMTLAGLLPPLAGVVRVDGRPLRADGHPDPRAGSRDVHFTADDAHIFATTVRENLLVAAPEGTDDETLLRALTRAGLGAWIESLPEGLDTVLTSGATTISGGQRRRLLLARALLTGARYLLLDEPTEHLDATGTRQLQVDLTEMARRSRLGVLIITHDETVLADATIFVGAHSPTGADAGPG